jgi:tetratricopeptide (TPR) repeat protein
MLGELYFRRCDFRTARSYFSQALKAAPHWSRIEAQQKIAASAANGDFSGIRRRGTDCMPKDISGDFRELPSSLDVKESERELELMVDEEAGDKLMPADPAQARAVYERARRDIADSHTDLPWSAQLFVRMARAAYTDHQPTAVVVADLQHAIGLSRPMLQASGNPDVQAVIAAGLSAAVRKMAGNLLRRGHPHEAAELLQEVTPFTSLAALVYLELGEALDADKGQQQPALDAFFEAWTANNGDRTTVGSFLMRKVIAIADENEGRGCWDDAEADYEKLRDSGVLDFMAADALGRAEVYETWSALLGAQQHQIEALEKHDAAQRVELSGDDQTALTAAVSQATAALDGGKPKSCPVQP